MALHGKMQLVNWKEGDSARIVSRPVTPEDRKANRYYEHMAGLTGTIQNLYDGCVALKVHPEALSPLSAEVRKESIRKMRNKLVSSISEEQKSRLSKEELEFEANYMLLVQFEDLTKV